MPEGNRADAAPGSSKFELGEGVTGSGVRAAFTVDEA
jgi:hypothetical protein